ncbi:unnamed protein product, partial [marine sediment metagenome]
LNTANFMVGKLLPLLLQDLEAKHEAERKAVTDRTKAITSIPVLQGMLKAKGITYPLPD